MAYSQQFLVCDSSTLANFKSWAQAISTFIGSTAGWLKSTDTGQVDWSAISAVPGSGAYVYEVWQPNDGLTNFFMKIEYGNVSGTNCPSLRISIGSATNGAGTLTGLVVGPIATNQTAFTAPSTTTTYECNLAGAPGRLHIMMWRNAPNNANQVLSVERGVNANGVYQGSHVTVVTGGYRVASNMFQQQSLLFGVGPAPYATIPGGGVASGMNVRIPYSNGVSSAFNGSIGMDLAAPFVGYHDYSLTGIGCGYAADFAEGVTFTATIYGSVRTYMASKNGVFGVACPTPTTQNYSGALLMRID
jgi:hypothetical protein